MLHGFVKSRFPPIKLFYEKNTHKKVVSDYYLAIPYGKKYLPGLLIIRTRMFA